jgi:acetyl-CoA acyltransferase 1
VGDPLAGYKARTAALAAGFPVTTSTMSLNRFCSSGLMAVKAIAESINAGSIDCGLAIGAESMSLSPDNGPPVLSTSVSSHPLAADALQPMGWTSENVAKDFNITREKHDFYAATSYQRAEKAQKSGWFEDEIIPVETTVKDPKTGQETKVTVTTDDGIRYGTTTESLGKIRQAFPQWGIGATTGGNASQITDGAGAVLLMRRSTAEALGQPIIAKYVHSLVVGLQPRIMGIGPAYAIPKLLETVGLTKEDIDAFEINEAFASMLAYTVESLGLDHEKVNPKGGAIAFGHPLGATGARYP